jgi:hypothetical protein
MAWLARLSDLWVGRKARIGFGDSGPGSWDTGQPGEEEKRSAFASQDLDIDLTAAQPPPDFLSSSFDLMQGLTVTEIPFDLVAVDLRTEFRRRT